MSRHPFSWAILACTLSVCSAGLSQQPANTQPANPQQTPAPAAPSTPAPPSGQGQAPASQTGSQPGSQDEQGFKIVREVNEVNLIFTVTDKHGNFIPNLKQSDFALLDDQKAPSRISSFTQQTNLPLRVGIVIDASTSIRTRFQFEQQAATEFLLQIV